MVAPLFALIVRRAGVGALAAAAMIAASAASAADLGTPLATSFQPVDLSKVEKRSDPEFRTLFLQWKQLDQVRPIAGAISVPSQRPVQKITFSSSFGVRTDPFRHTAAMHAGIDMPGAMGTPIYATADGMVERASWFGGYGNCVEIEHGRGLSTRYGHMSVILVHPGQFVHRGDEIGHMGSTGRSTGSHLHYEVRIDGHAVNPLPYLESADYVAAMQQRVAAANVRVAMGGPDDQ